jgi:hypothetical protein
VGRDAGAADLHRMGAREGERAMIDSFTKAPIKVSDDGDAGPYIMVQLDQLDLVKKLLDGADIRYSVDEDAISFNDQPYTAVVNLGHDVEVSAVQKLLDEHKSRRMARPRRPHSGRHG